MQKEKKDLWVFSDMSVAVLGKFPQSSWPAINMISFSVSQDTPICVTHYFYNPYLITWLFESRARQKDSAREVLDLLPRFTIFVPIGKVFQTLKGSTFPHLENGDNY